MQRASTKLDHTTTMAGPTADLQNDLVAIGESAARDFVRGTKKLRAHIEPMALGLAEARKRYPADRDFGAWLTNSAFAEIGKTDRAALIKLGQNWTDELAARIAELPLSSPELILRAVSDDRKSDDDDEDEDDDGDSEFYGAPRIARANEAWDTIDPRLVASLVEAIPGLTTRMVWEPSAGCGTMLDQLKAAGVAVVGSDIAPRRDDIVVLDLLTATDLMLGTDAVVTNPPWGKLAAPFVRKTLELAAPRKALVAMLLPLPWMTGRHIADMTGSPSFDVLIVPRYRARWMTDEEEAALEDGPQAPKMNHVWLVWDFARDPNLLPGIRFVDAPLGEATEIEEAAE